MNVAMLRSIATQKLDLCQIPIPKCGEGEVLVQVLMCGVCGTDLHIMDGTSYRPKLPFVLGHEPIGVVVGTHSNFSQTKVGRRVVPTIFAGCGTCTYCRGGDERLCPAGSSILGVIGRWGGFAEYVVIPERHLVEVPDSVATSVAASMVDSGATARNAARVVEGFEPSGLGLVVGLGPLGFLTAQFLKLVGVNVMAVEPAKVRLRYALSRGLTVVESLAETESKYDFVVECSGATQAVAEALRVVKPHGLVVLAGYSTVPNLDLGLVARRELTVRGVRSGRREDLLDALTMAAEQELHVPPASIFPLDEINTALQRLRGGQIPGKVLISPEQGASHG